MVSPALKMLSGLPGKILVDDGHVVLIEMSVDEWINVQSHPRQRDSALHAKSEHWREAKKAEGVLANHLARVTGALLDGHLYKVDGHTRAYLWRLGKLKRPRKVIVTAYRVRNFTELLSIYSVIDLDSAAEKGRDKILGAYNEHGLNIQSKLLRRATVSEALHIALRGIPRQKRSKRIDRFDIYRAVDVFSPEIKALDAIDPKPVFFPAGVLGAAFIMLALEPASIEFFRRLSEGEGEKRHGKMDPVENLSNTIKDYRAEKLLSKPSIQLDVCGRCIRAVQAWAAGPESKGYWLKNRVFPTDVSEYVEKVREKKGIQEEDSL